MGWGTFHLKERVEGGGGGGCGCLFMMPPEEVESHTKDTLTQTFSSFFLDKQLWANTGMG